MSVALCASFPRQNGVSRGPGSFDTHRIDVLPTHDLFWRLSVAVCPLVSPWFGFLCVKSIIVGDVVYAEESSELVLQGAILKGCLNAFGSPF